MSRSQSRNDRMECSQKKWRCLHKRKIIADIRKENLSNSSRTSFLTNSDSHLCPLTPPKKKKKCKKKMTYQLNSRHDYLTRLFERRKLKDKFLSKELKTPFDKKLNRSCWPIQLHKVCKIKKKPSEKKRKKPNVRSLRPRNFATPSLFTKIDRKNINYSYNNPSNSDLTYECFDKMMEKTSIKHFLYEPVTAEMLINVLQDPEHLKNGATLDTIISKLRALKLGLNPEVEMLKREVLRNLQSAIKLKLIYEHDGYYRVVKTPRMSKLARKKINSLWNSWYRK